ncbi:MAG: glycosyltransferase [bacterium]|nr:glycosyltransferase [bacterium]
MLDATVHMVVKNEDRWVWFALMAVKDSVSRILVTDTGSTDGTIDAIRSIRDKKISLTRQKTDDPKEIVDVRGSQIQKTDTPWIFIVDGDEIWPAHQLEILDAKMQSVASSVNGIVVHDKRCIGDVFHILPESYGRYMFKGRRGHLNLRLIRNIDGLDIRGEYPNEAFVDAEDRVLNDQDDRVEILDVWYLHTSHLPRSTSDVQVLNRQRKQKTELGMKIDQRILPEAFLLERPPTIPSPFTKRPFLYTLKAAAITPIRRAKQLIT